MRESNAIIFFLKYPENGKVKTRLARAVGDEHATQVYRWLVETAWEQAEGPWDRLLIVTPADSVNGFQDWLNPDYAPTAQVEGDLGDRIQHAVHEAFAQGYRKVICVGGDCPCLDQRVYSEAFRKLDIFDVCLAPATDGGYVLIGLDQPKPSLFQRIDWSTEHVFEQTLEAAGESGLSVGTMRAYSDVDTIEDYQAVKARFAEAP